MGATTTAKNRIVTFEAAMELIQEHSPNTTPYLADLQHAYQQVRESLAEREKPELINSILPSILNSGFRDSGYFFSASADGKSISYEYVPSGVLRNFIADQLE